MPSTSFATMRRRICSLLLLAVPLAAPAQTVTRVTITLSRDTAVRSDTVTARAVACCTAAGGPVAPVAWTWGTAGVPVRLLLGGAAAGTFRFVASDTGAVTVTAIGRTLASSARLVIVPQPPPPTYALTVVRSPFDSSTGPVLVSNGIPLPPGLVTPATLSRFHLVVGGVEPRLFVKALAGRHADGSLRAVLVQFDADVPAAGLPAAFTVSTPRAGPDLAERPALALPRAAALPTSVPYLISTRLGGDLTPDSVPAATPTLAWFATSYATGEAKDWKCGPGWLCGRSAQYDRSYLLYQQWLRTGNPTYWYHATANVEDWLRVHVTPNTGRIWPWNMNPLGATVHYWLTGSENSRLQVRYMAEATFWLIRLGGLERSVGDDRPRALAIQLLASTIQLDALAPIPGQVVNFYTPYVSPRLLDTLITAVARSQAPSGAFAAEANRYGGGQKNFMVGMLLLALERWYDEVTPDPRIPQIVKQSLDYMLAHEWAQDSLGFKYVSQAEYDSTGKLLEASTNQSGLNGQILPAYAWYAARFPADPRAPAYTQLVDDALVGLKSTSWWFLNGGKPFDEAYYRLWNVLAWRARAKPPDA
jgi:hypothetical protein